MINKKNVKKYCCEDISLIKNYKEALYSVEKYDCHHLLENQYKRKELIDLGLYYDRPASELVFLTHKEHISLHHTGNNTGRKSGFKHSEETKLKMSLSHLGSKHSKETKLKMSLSHIGIKRDKTVYDRTGANNSMFGKHHSEETRLKMSLAHKGKKRIVKSTLQKGESYNLLP